MSNIILARLTVFNAIFGLQWPRFWVAEAVVSYVPSIEETESRQEEVHLPSRERVQLPEHRTVTMNLPLLRFFFHGLALMATLLLWGLSAWNGTIKALVLAVYHARLADGTPLRTRYTGIQLIDVPIALLVAFFFYGTNGSVPGYQLFLLDAYSTLQSAFVWLYVESFRQSAKPRWVAWPVIFGLLWQGFGAAIALPLYYALHLSWLLTAPRAATSAVDLRGARVIPFGFLLGAFLPAVIGMLPTWTGAAARSAGDHQRILAAWQPDPLWVSLTQSALVFGLGRLLRTEGRGSSPQDQVSCWVRGAYLLAAMSSVCGHVYTMITVLLDPQLSLWHMYVPSGRYGPSGVSDEILIRGPWLFLQWDLIIISLSSVSWVGVLLHHAFKKPCGLWTIKVGLALTLGSVVIGPGATVSLALVIREKHLERLRKAHAHWA